MAISLMMAALCCVSGSVFAAPLSEDSSVLEPLLHERYPAVMQWRIAATSTTNTKRPQHFFAELPSGSIVTRNGHVFAIKSSATSAISARYLVSGMGYVLLASSYMKTGTVLRPQQLVTAERDVFALGCEPYAGVLGQDALRLRREIHEHEVLCREDLEPVPLIAKHDALTVSCSQGPITVAVAGEALTDGEFGRQIRIQREGTHEVIRATVTGKGEANACL